MERIAKILCGFYEVEYYALFNKRKLSQEVKARQMTMYIARNILKLSYPQIGKFFFRNHATAIHAVKTLSGELEVSRAKRSEFIAVKRLIYDAGIRTKIDPVKNIKFCKSMQYGYKAKK